MPAFSQPDEPDFDPFRPADEQPAGIVADETSEVHNQEQSEAASSLKKPAGAPPLGIRHLLLWMTCSGGLITIHRLILEWVYDPTMMEGQATTLNVLNLLYSIWAGPALVAILITAGCWIKGIRFPTQPGEWLLLIQGYLVLKHMLISAYMASRLMDVLDYGFERMVPISADFLGGLIYLLVGWKFRMTRTWKIGFLLQVAYWWLSLLPSLAVFLFMVLDVGSGLWALDIAWLTSPLYVLSMVLILVAVGLDWKRKIPRSWMHWTGILVITVSLLFQLSALIYFSFMN